MADTILSIHGVQHGTKDTNKAGSGSGAKASKGKAPRRKGHGMDAPDGKDTGVGGAAGPGAK